MNIKRHDEKDDKTTYTELKDTGDRSHGLLDLVNVAIALVEFFEQFDLRLQLLDAAVELSLLIQ